MIFKHMDRIVFAGDSVTDMESAQPVGEGLFENVGKSYVRIVENMLSAFYPEVYIRVTNSGISGNTSRDLLQRFDRDVVSLNPDWVSICIGINDVWRQFDSPAMPDVQVSPEEYRSNVEQMILSVKDNVKGVFLMTPYYMEPNAEDWMRKRMGQSAVSWPKNMAAVLSICRLFLMITSNTVILPTLHGIGFTRTRSVQP